jgi:hypothetical protein
VGIQEITEDADRFIERALTFLATVQTRVVQVSDALIGSNEAGAIKQEDLELIHTVLAAADEQLYSIIPLLHAHSDGAKLLQNALKASGLVHKRIVELVPGIGTE